MRRFFHTIRDPLGLHARPAGQLLARVRDAEAQITVTLAGHAANANDLMQIIGLNARCGDILLVTVDGPGEEQTAGVLEQFFQDCL